jgi:hypothetical protein
LSYIFVFDHFSPERGRKLFYYEIQCRRKQKKKIQKFKIQNLSVLICPIFQNPVSTINREKKKTLSAFQPRLRYFFIFPLKSRFKPDAEIATNKILLIMGFVLSWLIYGSLIKEKVPSSFIGLKILFQDCFLRICQGFWWCWSWRVLWSRNWKFPDLIMQNGPKMGPYLVGNPPY